MAQMIGDDVSTRRRWRRNGIVGVGVGIVFVATLALTTEDRPDSERAATAQVGTSDEPESPSSDRSVDTELAKEGGEATNIARPGPAITYYPDHRSSSGAFTGSGSESHVGSGGEGSSQRAQDHRSSGSSGSEGSYRGPGASSVPSTPPPPAPPPKWSVPIERPEGFVTEDTFVHPSEQTTTVWVDNEPEVAPDFVVPDAYNTPAAPVE